MQVEFTHLFYNEMHTKLGHPLGYQFEQRTGLGLTDFLNPLPGGPRSNRT
jgi:hypothetical protein